MHIRHLNGCHKVTVLESYDGIKRQMQQMISVQDVVQGTCPAQEIPLCLYNMHLLHMY